MMRYVALVITAVGVLLNVLFFKEFYGGQAGKPGLPGQEAVAPVPDDRAHYVGGPKSAAIERDLGLPFRRVAQPASYRGIYLNNYHARVPEVLKRHIALAKAARVNAFVMDMQDAVYFKGSPISRECVQLVAEAGLYPIARIVCFPYGLKVWPVPQAVTAEIRTLALAAVKAGFSEVQFDYIRFEDSGRLSHVNLAERFRTVEGVLKNGRGLIAPYGVWASADIFGRIPLNSNDPIGQRMEGLDEATDILLPMAYPSHYTWSRYMQANPYFTVHKTAAEGKKRLKKAGLVMYIQGFPMAIGWSGLSLVAYIAHQIKACDDAGVRGWVMWNASQTYETTYEAMRLYYGGHPIQGLAGLKATDPDNKPDAKGKTRDQPKVTKSQASPAGRQLTDTSRKAPALSLSGNEGSVRDRDLDGGK